ncbi:hypothetical protein RFI_12580 [Reticulomyxa filosa]|uniref:Uncharacterized protein n=1 Tax=Reticulomyxa filosa TaxID=46433 RepID=X6NE22_RETFI|nr:hypothetical protein RFI_12580 [Reticulomyxa filosa]|eukprot:ETO24575.1 hypothetical protein RFI_12580 [Reticulomyxa filosa]
MTIITIKMEVNNSHMNRLPDDLHTKLKNMLTAVWQSQQDMKGNEANKWGMPASFAKHYFESLFQYRVLAADPDWRSRHHCYWDEHFQGEQWVDLFYDLKEMDTDSFFFERFDPSSEKLKFLQAHSMYIQSDPISFHDIQVLQTKIKIYK